MATVAKNFPAGAYFKPLPPPHQPTPRNTVFLLLFDTHLLTFTMSISSTESTRSTPELEAATAVTKLSPHEQEPVTTISKRPNKGKFNEDEADFLQKFLDEYLAAESSNKKKGAKKAWIKANVYYKYIKEFQADGPQGPNLSSLLKVQWQLISLSNFEYSSLFSDNCALVQQQSDCHPRTRI